MRTLLRTPWVEQLYGLGKAIRTFVILIAVTVTLFNASRATANEEAMVIWQRGTQISRLDPSRHQTNAADIETVQPEKLVLPTGFFNFHGTTYNLTEPGLYRFIFWGTPDSTGQFAKAGFRNVIAVKESQEPIETIVQGVSNLHVHGEALRGIDTQKLPSDLVSHSPYAILTCGGVTDLCLSLLQEKFPPAQYPTYHFKRIETYRDPGYPENDWDDGHIMLQVSIEGNSKWNQGVLIDTDMGYMFKYRSEDRFMNVEQFIQAVQDNKRPKFVQIAKKAGFVNPLTQYRGLYYGPCVVLSNDNVWSWYRRVVSPKKAGDPQD